jgi:ABC-2 type transport system permease protein
MPKIWTIIDKEWAEVFKNRLVLFTVIFMPILFTALPLIIIAIGGSQVDIGDATDMPPSYQEMCGDLTGTACFTLMMVNQFLLLFMMMPLIIPVTIAAYSIVGEKTTHCLEPLLATPITTAELLIGKSLAALIPGVLATWLSFGVFASAAYILVQSPELLRRILDPMWIIAIGLVGPLLALAGINVTLMVSSRVSDPRTAEQVSMMLILPLLGVFFAQIAGVLMVNAQIMQLAAVIMVAVDAGLVSLGVRVFQRETILTKWK